MKYILIADDEDELAQSIKSALSSDYQVDIVNSGLSALKSYKDKVKSNTPYDVLILDINFSAGINGLEVARLIRSKDSKVKILIFSAYEYMDSLRENVVSIGAKFCPKPLDPREIHDFIQAPVD